jgi:carbamoyl-phosphate synthase small subunit
VIKKQITGRLVLEDGTEYQGYAFGRIKPCSGEVVFTTGMTGYPQTLTDPSYCGQILVNTYPLNGNYGVPLMPKTLEPYVDEHGIPRDFESLSVQVSGFIVQEICETPSHFSSRATLSQWLEKNGVPGLYGIDTRALTQKLREHGVMRGKIIMEGKENAAVKAEPAHPVAEVSCSGVILYKPNNSDVRPLKIVLVDCGAKANIIRCLLARGIEVLRVPWDYDITSVEFDGVFLSNGPGDPKTCGKTIALVRRAFTAEKPLFGICLGNQIMALAAGADTYKLPYGHRAQNQPCIEVKTGRCAITSQNHGYAVREESLPQGWEPWFVNANDGTIEGIRSTTAPFSAVQFHPEGCPGPRDTEYLIDEFLLDVRRNIG